MAHLNMSFHHSSAYIYQLASLTGDIMALNGALTIVPLCFIAPCVFYMIKKGRENLSMSEKFMIILIIALNTIVGVMGVIASIRQIILDANTYKMFQ